MTLPPAARPFVRFPHLLRDHGFAVAPDQTIGFLEAVKLLGPRDLADIRRAAVAMLAIPREREAEFDALFRAFFLGQAIPAPVPGPDDEAVEAHTPRSGDVEADAADEISDAGAEATAAERLSTRDVGPVPETEALRRFRRLAPRRLPSRRSYRFAATKRPGVLDLRRTLRESARRDGEAVLLRMRARKVRQRRLVVLIDVSGSMREGTESRLTVAHALVQVAERVEVFTLGTRLTRVSAELRVRDRARALERVGRLVADLDGGTRIGEALRTFLDIPRFAGFARGALVLVLSDGLERGGPAAMVAAVDRLSRLAWRLHWLSPLAGDPDYRPETSALSAVLARLDAFGDGGDAHAITDHLLTSGRR